MTEELEKMFLNEKPVKLLTRIDKTDNGTHASALAEDIDATYSHTVRCLQKLEGKGLIKFRTRGRKKEAELTDRGELLARDFFQLLKDMTSDS